jgi:hypothetical protein
MILRVAHEFNLPVEVVEEMPITDLWERIAYLGIINSPTRETRGVERGRRRVSGWGPMTDMFERHNRETADA